MLVMQALAHGRAELSLPSYVRRGGAKPAPAESEVNPTSLLGANTYTFLKES